jgi:hypothetical protein
MLADAGAPAVLADAPRLRRPCWQMPASPPQPLQWLCGGYGGRCWRPRSPCIRSCGGYAGRCWCIPQSLHWFLRRLCSHFWRPLCGALSRCLSLTVSVSTLPHCLPLPPAPPHRRSAAPPCRRQPAPRGAHGTCPDASRTRTFVPFPPRPQCAARCELHGRRHASGGGARKIVVLTGARSARGKGEVNRGGGIGGACPPAARRPGKGPQVHWAQQWAGVRPTDSPRARSPIKTVCQLPVMM